MNAPFERRRAVAWNTNTSGARLALDCARSLYEAVDRRMPEAAALTNWLRQSAAAFGLPDTAVPEYEPPYRARCRGVPALDWRKIGSALTAAEGALTQGADSPADRWIAAIAETLALDPLEARMLSLGVHYGLDKRVDKLFDATSECRGGGGRFHRDTGLFALLLQATPADIEMRLRGDETLRASGLFRLEQDGELHVLERLVSLIRQDVTPAADFYDQLLGSIAADPLPWESFEHLGREAEVVASVLRAALSGRERGINILLYGPPGTGKTSFAATLAARTGARLRPVTEADEEGDEPSRSERLAGLRLAQSLAAPEKTLLLFDEAEDLFVRRGGGFDASEGNSSVFMHRLLERMATPVIWTANDIGVLGPAVLRRMTMCLELKVPNLATRTRLWRQMGETEGVLLPEADAARLARLVPAAPAVASAALRATRLAGGGAETAQLIVEGVARAVHGGGLPAPEPERDAAYDPELVNAGCDLAALTADLLRPEASLAVSFLLSGPPGAGKSAWVRHLAAQMGLPVLHKRASDLLNPFVGGTEQNIANAFAEARDAHAFLVFDEADSLLLERAGAVRGWEISQVNEMLTWMEQHALPFACTSNLPGRLDSTSLRRFLVKMRFDWMTRAQARLAFERFFGVAAPDALDRLDTLTPADFSLVRRRAALRGGAPDPGLLLRLLAAECEGRTGGRSRMGFVAWTGE
jgi:AAA+ superfamily predicted ATPase